MAQPKVQPGFKILRTEKVRGLDRRGKRAPVVANLPRVVPRGARLRRDGPGGPRRVVTADAGPATEPPAPPASQTAVGQLGLTPASEDVLSRRAEEVPEEADPFA